MAIVGRQQGEVVALFREMEILSRMNMIMGGLWARGGALGLVLALALGMVGCSGGDENPPATTGTPGTAEGESASAPGTGSNAAAGSEAPPSEAPEAEAPAAETIPALVELEATLAPEGEPTPGHVDLLHHVQSSVAIVSLYRGELRQITNLYDGNMETAWNSATMPEGDTSPRSIQIRMPEGVEVHAIDLTAGYVKVRGENDLFTQNLRLRRVRVTHDGHEVVATLQPDERGLQRIPVQGGGGDWQIDLIEWQAGTRADWRELVISELRVMGVPGANTPRASAPNAVLGTLPAAPTAAAPAGLDEPEDGQDSDDLDDTDTDAAPAAQATTQMAQREGMHLTRLVLAPEMDGREPLEPRNTYNKEEDDRIYCFFELANPESEAGELTLAWEDESGQGRGEPTAISVPGHRRFLHYRYTSVGWRRPGTYSCVVRDGDTELGRTFFTVTR